MSQEKDVNFILDAIDALDEASRMRRIEDLAEKLFISSACDCENEFNSDAHIKYCFDAAKRFIEFEVKD